MGMASNTAKIVAISATCSESSRRSMISSITGRSVHIEMPKSPFAIPTIQSPNCVRSGRSRPSRLRSNSTVSWETLPPSPRSFTSTMSPGTTRSMKNTSTATPISVGIINRTRFTV